MVNDYFRIYAVTTEEGLKNICSNSRLTSKICTVNIKCVEATRYPSVLYYFETHTLKLSEASELTGILKKYDYYEYVLMTLGADCTTSIRASDEPRYLGVCHTVNVYNDDGDDDIEPLDASELDDLGIPLPRAPVPSMFKFTQVGDNNTQIEKAEVVEIHHHK